MFELENIKFTFILIETIKSAFSLTIFSRKTWVLIVDCTMFAMFFWLP